MYEPVTGQSTGLCSSWCWRRYGELSFAKGLTRISFRFDIAREPLERVACNCAAGSFAKERNM